jgi:2-oxoglutarate ferredoxin oxidoreductase subunit beta
MNGLSDVIEAGLRYPGFAFINVQSPCVTFGRVEAQLKAHRTSMRPIVSASHDSADRERAMRLAAEYGQTLYTGILYQDPAPEPTYDKSASERARALAAEDTSRANVLNMFAVR